MRMNPKLFVTAGPVSIALWYLIFKLGALA
jgi:hypothetical protein